MHRLLVLSGLAAAIVTIPALASAGNPLSPNTAIGHVIAGPDRARAADYWTPERMAAASALPLRRGDGDGASRPPIRDAA